MASSLDAEIGDYFERYAALVYRRALVLLGSKADAEDVVQEVFVRASANLDAFRGESQISTWLYRITTNFCLSQLRSQTRQGELLRERYENSLNFAGAPDPAEAFGLRELLAKADPQQAHAAVYVYVDGMTRPEAAQALNVSLRTVGNLLNRFATWAREEFSELDHRTLSKISRVESTEHELLGKSHSALPDSSSLGVYVTGGSDDSKG